MKRLFFLCLSICGIQQFYAMGSHVPARFAEDMRRRYQDKNDLLENVLMRFKTSQALIFVPVRARQEMGRQDKLFQAAYSKSQEQEIVKILGVLRKAELQTKDVRTYLPLYGEFLTLGEVGADGKFGIKKYSLPELIELLEHADAARLARMRMVIASPRDHVKRRTTVPACEESPSVAGPARVSVVAEGPALGERAHNDSSDSLPNREAVPIPVLTTNGVTDAVGTVSGETSDEPVQNQSPESVGQPTPTGSGQSWLSYPSSRFRLYAGITAVILTLVFPLFRSGGQQESNTAHPLIYSDRQQGLPVSVADLAEDNNIGWLWRLVSWPF